uniref:C2H2-type domain-containing protein n=1 Tax=Elaeophora elaphi TaxID=1147741 RepID=A0A0R3RJM9_9BILA
LDDHSKKTKASADFRTVFLFISAGGVSNGRAEQRSREEMQQYIGRDFPSHAFQTTQVNNDGLDLWPNVSGADNFPSSISGNTYGYGPGPGASTMYLPNLLNLPPLPPVYLRCPECGICKMSSEEMEVHIKVEHLHWSPFQCTECYAERSTDFQLREHVHSTHRKNYEHKYIYAYHDNPTAKRLLQLMMDRCLMNARRAQPPPLVGSSQPSPTVTAATTLPPHFHAATFPVNNVRERLITHTNDLDRRSTASLSPTCEGGIESPMRNISALTNGRDHISVNQQLQRSGFTPAATVGATATAISKKRTTSDNTMSWNTNTDAVLSAIRVATNENADEQEGGVEGSGAEDGGIGIGGEMDDEFNHEVKSTFDVAMEESTIEQSDEALLTATAIDGGQDATDILGNVAEIFSAGDIAIPWKRRNRGGNNNVHDSDNITDCNIRNERPKATKSSLAKRRMMGICKCKQLITAGARQMHIFYHMAKDRQLFRFRCKYPGCQVQHYRKDQMENHQSKVHGAINPMLIEDRTAELFKISQEVSLDLLGTTGNKPGPTAARAQMIYDQMMAAQARNPRNSRRKKRAAERALAVAAARAVATARVAVATAALNAQRMAAIQEANRCSTTEQSQLLEQQYLPSVPSTSREISSIEQTDDQQLHCQKCHKLLHNKIRGFHVLWHMSKDLGINRYICKFCDFGHDRKQAVVSHGRREHGTEDCCEDHVEEYSDEVKAMTEQCFGLQPTSSHDSNVQCKLSDQTVNNEEMIAESVTNANITNTTTISEEIRNSTVYAADEYDAKSSSALHITDSSQFPPRQSETSSIVAVSRSFASTSSSSSCRDRMRKARNRRFGMRKPPSKLKRKEMAKLREISMRLGGAQYFKKRFNEAAHCQKCGLLTTSRLSDHAYKHLDVQLFLCPQCDIGNQSRDLVVKHIRDVHSSQEHPIDERWKYRVEIKEIIRECYPAYFIDAPIPTAADIEKLYVAIAFVSKNFNTSKKALVPLAHWRIKITRRKQSLSSGRFFDVLGSTEDDQQESVDASLERDFGGEAGDGDSDDERQEEGLEQEQDAQSYTEGGDYGVDDNMLCEADHAQERFVMENDGDQSVDSDTSGDDAIIEENGHDEAERFAGASSGQSSITGLPLLENEDVLGAGILVKNEPDIHSDLTGEAEIAHIVEEEEDEGEEEM